MVGVFFPILFLRSVFAISRTPKIAQNHYRVVFLEHTEPKKTVIYFLELFFFRGLVGGEAIKFWIEISGWGNWSELKHTKIGKKWKRTGQSFLHQQKLTWKWTTDSWGNLWTRAFFWKWGKHFWNFRLKLCDFTKQSFGCRCGGWWDVSWRISWRGDEKIGGGGLGCGRWKLIATIHRPCHETIYLVKL